MKYFLLTVAIFQRLVPFLSALGQVHQSLKDVLQAKDKCVSQRSGLHPSTPIQEEQVREGLGVQPSVLSSTPAIWEVNALAFCSHWGVDIPQDVCDSCFWNMWVSANLLSSSQEGSFIIEDALLGASS